MTYIEPKPTDAAGIFAQQMRTDVTERNPIECRCRWHAGRCVVETLSDGSKRHVEDLPAPWGAGGRAERLIHVITTTGFRSQPDAA